MLLTGLIGWPVGHSRSPAMHNAAFAVAGIEGVYVPLPVHPERVGEAVAGLRALGFRGANVTVPHKQTVIPHLDELSPAARAIGALNTIVVRENGSLFGDNTDARGFLADLVEQGIMVEEMKEGGALIIGAGGSARAVAYALTSTGIPVRIMARRFAQAAQLIADIRSHLTDETLIVNLQSSNPNIDYQISKVKLIVNCTPVGMVPHVDASPWPDGFPFHAGQFLYDLVYNPSETRLMRQARAGGATVSNGLGMLLHQGALAWEQWTGVPAPLAAMRRGLEDGFVVTPPA